MERAKRVFWDARGRGSGAPLPPPSRPQEADIRAFEACAAALARSLGARPPRALMLGLTRGIATMRWPAGTVLAAMDWSEAMLHRAWPAGDLSAHAAPVIGDWREMPLRDGQLDLVIGDGCYASLDSFDDCAAVSREVRRVLRPGGEFVQRCFLRPQSAESTDALFEAVLAGRVASFEEFRWRLAMALHPPGEGVVAGEVWQAWHERVREPLALLGKLGWSQGELAAIDGWKDQRARVPLPTLAELEALAAGRFTLAEVRTPAYRLGECFPVVVLRARP
jgi:SAM-dependent methyltransferase